MPISENFPKIKKKVLIVEDSALMRRVLCDIIATDERFQVADKATNGLEALEFLSKNTYDVMVLDVNMPKMDGIQLLRELQKQKIAIKVLMSSTDTKKGASVTIEALELGALDFIQKPSNFLELRQETYQKKFMHLLNTVVESEQNNLGREQVINKTESVATPNVMTTVKGMTAKRSKISGQKIVALACSTGGPKALQSVIPKLPKDLPAPVLIVQHMPAGFTKSLAERLNLLSQVEVVEAAEGDMIVSGKVYLAKGGAHMNVATNSMGQPFIHYTDEPSREGVKPCANYMYESLMNSNYAEVICVVLTGMGADGMQGIVNLDTKKKVHVIAQDEATSTVYGMPKAIQKAGLVNQVVPLEDVAQEIVMNVGGR